jgi:LIVCS family branched-chain amino acid:cation transporter
MNQKQDNQNFCNSKVLSAGIAMFAMLFGAGNVALALALGRDATGNVGLALIGFLIGAIVIPLVGLIAAMLCDGNYKKLFGRLGILPGMLVAIVAMSLFGPFGAIPRCIAMSHAAIKVYVPQFNLLYFSLFASALIFACTIRRSGVVRLLGRYVGPLKIILLFAIILKGLFTATQTSGILAAPQSGVLMKGLFDGYGTLDLIGMIFFAGLIFSDLRKHQTATEKSDHKKLVIMGLKAGSVAALVLGFVYAGFCIVASMHAGQFHDVDKYELLNVLAPLILGAHAGFLANLTVAISCFATAVGLTTVFADFLSKELFQKKVSYQNTLVLTVLLSGAMANVGFRGIMSMILPVVELCYPALIVLCLVTIAHIFWGFKPVKTPVLLAFLLSLLSKYL